MLHPQCTRGRAPQQPPLLLVGVTRRQRLTDAGGYSAQDGGLPKIGVVACTGALLDSGSTASEATRKGMPMPERIPRHNLKVGAECWYVVSCGARMVMLPPTITKHPAPQSRKRQRDGLASCPVPDGWYAAF